MMNKLKAFFRFFFPVKTTPKKKLSYCEEYPWAPGCRIYED
jgi:hypothetical protein